MKSSFLLLGASLVALSISLPALAQDHSAHQHPSADTPPPGAEADPHAGHAAPDAAAVPDPHAGHAMPATPADPHAGHVMPGVAAAPDPHAGHAMPAAPADPHAGHVMPNAGAAPDPHAGHVMPATPADPHAGHVMPGAADPHAGHHMAAPDPHAGHNPPATTEPPPPTDHAADTIWGAGAMAASRANLPAEHGAFTYGTVMIGLAEYRAAGPGRGYRWEGEAWYGGDEDGVVLKSEGEGDRRSLETAEIQALYARAIDPYLNLQAGIRYDFQPKPSRGYAVLGIEGLAPYWFEVGAALFVSNKGDALARLEATYDQLITQRLILQPRVELNFAAQNVRATGIVRGLSTAELGLRLRYEFEREFAPYVGVSYERKLGATARFARAGGERTGGTNLVIGVRAWF